MSTVFSEQTWTWYDLIDRLVLPERPPIVTGVVSKHGTPKSHAEENISSHFARRSEGLSLFPIGPMYMAIVCHNQRSCIPTYGALQAWIGMDPCTNQPSAAPNSRHEVMLWLLTFATHVVLLAARRTSQAPGSRTGEKSPKHNKSSKTGQHDDIFLDFRFPENHHQYIMNHFDSFCYFRRFNQSKNIKKQ